MKKTNIMKILLLMIPLLFLGCEEAETCQSDFAINKIKDENLKGIKNTPAYNYFKDYIQVTLEVSNVKTIKTLKNSNECSGDLILSYNYIKETTDPQMVTILRSLNINKINDVVKESHPIKYTLELEKNGETILK